MNNHDVTLEPCYVLHQRAYRDTSALVDVFSKEHGRIGLVARGVKSSKSKLRGLLQPFTPLLISWGGKGDLQTLKSIESTGLAMNLTGRWVMSGFYLNELLMRLLIRHDPHASLFNHYESTLKLLSTIAGIAAGTAASTEANNDEKESVSGQHQRILRLFEKNLLHELGYGLILDHDVESGVAIEIGKNYQYYPEKGPVLSSTAFSTGSGAGSVGNEVRESEFHGSYHRTVKIQIQGDSLISLAQDKLDDPLALQESKRLMRTILSGYLGSKPLQSREMFKQQSRYSSNRME